MKRFIKVMFILALVLCFAVPAFAIKILPYNVPLQDLMRWDKYGVALRLSNPEGETLTVSWPATVDLWNYDGATWTFNLPSGDTFAFSKGVATTGASSFTLSSAATVGTIRTLTVSQTMTAAATANMVEALYVSLTSNVKTGAWANAIVGKIDYSTSGAAHGMAAAICAEMIPPDGSLARGALYALDLEFGCGSSSTWGSAGPVAFIKMENYGTASHFSTNAFLFHLVGEASATGDLLYNNTIKCRVGTTTWYLALSSLENSYAAQNAAGPIILNEAATTANPTLCPNRAEDDTGIGWASNHIHIVLGGSSEYSFSTTTLDMNNNTITDAGDIICTDAAGPTLQDEPATTTNPTLIPNRFDETTGIGWNTAEIHFVVSGVDEVQVTADILAPGVNDSCALGSTSYYWSDLFLASEAVININNDITLTHAANLLTFAGGNFRMGTTDRIEFRDATEYIHSLNDGYIDVVATTGLRVNSDVFIGENLGGHGFTLYAESSGAYLYWEGATSDVLVLVNAQLDSTQTDLSSAVDAIYGYCDAGAAWTGGNMVGVRGKVAISGSGNFVSATGVWAGLDFATATGSGSGLTCALNAEVSSDNSTAPNAIIYIQSLPGASANFSDVPYIVFSETKGGALGTGSRYLFEVGHAAANTIPTIGTGELFYNHTLQIAVNETAGNRINFFIPLSTIEGTYTTEYLIDVTVTAGTAIDIGTSAIGIDFTGAYSTSAIQISTALPAWDDHAIDIVATSTDAGTGTIVPLYVSSIFSVSGAVGRAAEFVLAPTAQMGGWGNAVKAFLDMTGASGSIGLLAGLCAEIKLPDEAMTGTYAVLELELVAPTNFVANEGLGSNCVSFINANLANTGDYGEIDDHGYFLNVQGLESLTTQMLYNNTLKCVIGSTKLYLPFSTVEGSYTTTYPIDVSVAGGVALTIGTSTTGINVAANIVMPQFLTIGTLANPLHWAGAVSNILIYQENLSTTPGSVTANKFSLSAAQSGATTAGRLECFRAEVKTYSTTAVTADMRALVGQVEFSGDMTYIGNSTADFSGAYGVIASIWSASDVTADSGNLGKMYPLGIFFGLETNTSLSGEDAYIYIYNYGKVCPNSVMKLYNASTPAEPTYLFDKAHSTLGSASGPFYTQDVNPHSAPADASLGADGHIKILIGATPYYIPFFANLE